jgi:type I restriction enzyme, S subunit
MKAISSPGVSEGLPPHGWRTMPFDALLSGAGLEKRPSVPRSEFQRSGRYPVVDQGQQLIAGFTDAEPSVHREDLPIILFGDHTRAVKFVDFPFAAGADGTKLLRPASPDLEPRFLYYLLLGADLPSRGYNRHFGSLREREFQVPIDRSEQCAIAGVLSKLQSAVVLQDRTVAALKALKAATMAKVFREGLRGERLKQTEIGEIPESWDAGRVGSLAHPVSGGTPSKNMPEWWSGSIPWASPKDMKVTRLVETEDHLTEEAIKLGSRLVPEKTIFVVIRGMVLAKDVPIAIADVPMAFNQDMRALVPTGAIDPDFLLYAMTSRKQAMTSEIGTSAHGTRRIGSKAVEDLLVPVPRDRDEQERIGQAILILERRVQKAEKSLEERRSLFHAALESLVTGRLRVAERSQK